MLPRLGRLDPHSPIPIRLSEPYIGTAKYSELPKISVVTPAYKQASYIERTIRSVLEQSYPNIEYYVQDGCSNDGTEAILRRYSDRLSGWTSCVDEGQSQAINLAFANTSGEIMAWLNSDDLLLPGALNYVADFFNRHPEVDVVYGNRILIDEDDQQVGRWILPAHNYDVLSWYDFIPQETLFWRRSIWEKSGGYIDESFRFAMDWDLLLRFRESGARFYRLPRFIGGFRLHSQQKTSVDIIKTGLHEMDRLRKKSLGYVPSKTTLRINTWPYLLRHLCADWWWGIRNLFGRTA